MRSEFSKRGAAGWRVAGAAFACAAVLASGAEISRINESNWRAVASYNTDLRPVTDLLSGQRACSAFSGTGRDFLLILHSLTSDAVPKREASQRLSTGTSVGEAALRLDPIRVPPMSFNVFARFPVPTIALAVSAVLTGCGGGGGSSDQETSTVEASATSTAPGASTSSASTATGPSTTTSTAATSTGTDTATSTSASTSTDTTAQQSGDTSTVAVADTTAATSLGVGGGVAVVSAASTRSGVGMNLTGVTSYSPEMPTIDLMKKASPWITQCQNGYQSCTAFTGTARAYDTLEEASLSVDSDGWVKRDRKSVV